MDVPESAYRAFFETDPAALAGIDPETGRIRVCNERFCEITDRDREDTIGRHITAFTTSLRGPDDDLAESVRQDHGDDTVVVWQIQPDTGAESIPVEVRLSTVPVTGDDLVLARCTVISDRTERDRILERKSRAMDAAPTGITISESDHDDGEVTNYVGFQEDITERKRYQQELELAHHLLEALPTGVFRTDPTPDGTFEYVNPALVSFLGAQSADQLREHRVADFYADPEARAELLEALHETDDAHVQREVTLETLDGERRDVVVTASLTEDEMGTEHVHKVVQDITERKEREQALERYERLVENLPIGVYQNTPGPEGEFTFVNEAMVDIFDADSIADLYDHSVGDLYVDATEREAFSEHLQQEGVVTERELELRTLRGDAIWGAVTAITSDVDGETVFDGVVQDISERKQYEKRLKEQRDDLDVLNQMLRHDIRNDLQLVTAYADFLADQVDDEGQEYIETILESAAHAVELTQTAGDMADVMLSTEDNRQRVDLRGRLDSELDEIRSEFSNAVITVEGLIPPVSVTADDMLTSVFRNLLTNAVNHNDKDIPEVQVSATERDEAVVVRVADNGPGVPDDQKATIFGKGEKGLESEGTGIGLYLVETLVDTYGGDVRVEDNDPHGTVFVVELPKAT